jgi:mannose-6-phosphate isomerase-like protein (cupin superfamily)
VTRWKERSVRRRLHPSAGTPFIDDGAAAPLRRDPFRIEADRALMSLILSTNLSEKSATFPDHALESVQSKSSQEEFMSVARHPLPKELVGVPIEEIMKRYVGRFRDRKPDWAAFEDAKIEGYKRAQHRFIGAGGSGKHGDPTVIPAGNFTLSVMFVNPGQGNAAHTHEVEEIFFVLQGLLDVFVEDETGKRVTTRLGPWECIACPAGVIHGYQNDSLEPVYFQVMLGRGKPETMGYADEELYKRRSAHLEKTDA